jgi:hypothetical protein
MRSPQQSWVERLDLARLIDRQNNGVVWQTDIEPDDIAQLGDELRFKSRRMMAVRPNDAGKQMDEESSPATPLQEFLGKLRLRQIMDQPPNKEHPVRGERQRLIGILALLTRLISRKSSSNQRISRLKL